MQQAKCWHSYSSEDLPIPSVIELYVRPSCSESQLRGTELQGFSYQRVGKRPHTDRPIIVQVEDKRLELAD